MLWNSGRGYTLRFLEYLLKDYSKRGLTESTDRAVALSGLAHRIKGALGCQERYGIFGSYLHRNLLWRLQHSDVPVTRINYTSIRVPSWSWMAYTGGIEFIDDIYGVFDVCENLKFADENMNTLIADLWEIRDYKFKEHEGSAPAIRRTLVCAGTEIGWIEHDVNNGQVLPLEGVTVAGRSKAKAVDVWSYHVLVLRRGADSEYHRAGFGIVQEGFVSWQKPGIRIV